MIKAIKLNILSLLVWLIALHASATAQTLYVDSKSGKDSAMGTAKDPLKSLTAAVKRTNSYKGDVPVDIKIAPGLYILYDQLAIKTSDRQNKQTYTIEALTMPSNAKWTPQQCPVIESLSGINDTTGFKHCIGLSIQKSNVIIRGLKFLGNPNAEVDTYYPIRRAEKTLSGLEVSRCYFIGEKNSSAIQSALWVSGPGIHIDHCIFQSCKIVTVLGSGVNNFSLTHSIINDAYNTAIWYGFSGTVPSFTFKNNVVINSNYVMVYPLEDGQPAFTFSSSYLVGNTHYLGGYPKAQDRFITEPVKQVKESNVRKSGRIKQVSVANDGITRDNLNLTKDSDGKGTLAGIN